ncbi:nucleoside 2-deoxyribosyltransferase [Methanohalophilus levihalophilus]|uniref:nucleoside 2-deoxyribosyltransferase n=1 Tax=Methanohalophilus levihalophilus TaxID=1431282 RepID=UPI001AEA0535|nr:nucleoside 2-deoxyribosyltransferase domain-containing protein [Methanohalophilus levihalophilus]MBP2030863.1 nucleoside 2-deoxyribosyltransferase [Methanohalophilus levihalophilus]
MTYNIYIAGPLFSEAELEFNLKLDEFLANIGFHTFLPQRDGYELSELISESLDKEKAGKMIFSKDLDEIKKADIIVFIMDGRVPDEGACVEIGLGFAYGKECIGLKTDSRTFMDNSDNPMLSGVLKGRIASSFSELELLLEPYIKLKEEICCIC